jgi:hypothetical protein
MKFIPAKVVCVSLLAAHLGAAGSVQAQSAPAPARPILPPVRTAPADTNRWAGAADREWGVSQREVLERDDEAVDSDWEPAFDGLASTLSSSLTVSAAMVVQNFDTEDAVTVFAQAKEKYERECAVAKAANRLQCETRKAKVVQATKLLSEVSSGCLQA